MKKSMIIKYGTKITFVATHFLQTHVFCLDKSEHRYEIGVSLI